MSETPFADVQLFEGGFSIPDLKWRELVFTGAMRLEGNAWVRDPTRFMTPFAIPGLLPEGASFEVTRTPERALLRLRATNSEDPPTR